MTENDRKTLNFNEFHKLINKIYINSNYDEDLSWCYMINKYVNKDVKEKTLILFKNEEVNGVLKKKQQITDVLNEMSGGNNQDMVKIISDILFSVIKGYYNSIYISDNEGCHFLEVDTTQVLIGMQENCIRSITINTIIKTILLDKYNMPTELLKTIVNVIPEIDKTKLENILLENENYDFLVLNKL